MGIPHLDDNKEDTLGLRLVMGWSRDGNEHGARFSDACGDDDEVCNDQQNQWQ